MDEVEFRHFHLFCGLGGGAKGFNRGRAALGPLRARFRCIGGIDVDAAAIRDFSRAAGVPGTVLDLFDAEQYADFHGVAPPAGWRPAGPDDIRRAAGGERPHIVFLSAPCKGFSGLLSETASRSAKYQALNRLTVRGVWLMLEAWADDPPELVIFENVPRIASRGRPLLDRIVGLLGAYGYAVAETTHDCGELGGLAQSRKRFLLVARHAAKVPPYLYEPVRRPLRGVGEVLDRLPVPGGGAGGAMHRVPSLQWRTWVRLAFVEAGRDWRSLNRLRVEDGALADYGIVPAAPLRSLAYGVVGWDGATGTVAGESLPSNGRFAVADPRAFESRHNGILGVTGWEEPCGTVTGNARPMTGTFSVADPRPADGCAEYGQYGVRRWGDSTGTVTGQRSPGQGGFSVADPRYGADRFKNVYRVVDWRQPSATVTAGQGPTSGGMAVADPRTGYGDGAHSTKLRVVGYDDPAPTVTGSDRVGSGALSVADPRPRCLQGRDHYVSGGHYGVLPWDGVSGAVCAAGQHDNGPWSVADPRDAAGDEGARLPAAGDRLVAVIRALDGTWHRPFTTLELAALQGLVDPEEQLELDGLSDSDWRERIGNAVPPPAAEAIAGVMGRTLLLARVGETFTLSADPIWVRPITAALAVARTLPEVG